MTIISSEILSRLPSVARDHALHLEDASMRQDHFATCVWAAVFLEALLEHLLVEARIAPGGRDGTNRPDLGGMIDQLKGLAGQNSAESRLLAEVTDCAHSIRSIRNRLVHNTGRAKDGMESASQRVKDDVRCILEWWRMLPRKSEAQIGAEIGRVFLSTITPDQPRHRGFLADVRSALEARRMSVLQVTLDEYDRRRPLTRVSEEMRNCDAVLIVGLERSHAYFVRDREGTNREYSATNRRYSSAWLHIEAGLANGLGKPVFVICEPQIADEGIFDRNWNEYVVVEFASLSVNDPAVKSTIGKLEMALKASLTT